MTYVALMWFFLINYIDKFEAPMSPLITSILCSFLVVFYISSFSKNFCAVPARACSCNCLIIPAALFPC